MHVTVTRRFRSARSPDKDTRSNVLSHWMDAPMSRESHVERVEQLLDALDAALAKIEAAHHDFVQQVTDAAGRLDDLP